VVQHCSAGSEGYWGDFLEPRVDPEKEARVAVCMYSDLDNHRCFEWGVSVPDSLVGEEGPKVVEIGCGLGAIDID